MGIRPGSSSGGPAGRLSYNSGTATCTVSPIRFKHDVQDLGEGLDKLRLMRPRSFKRNSDGMDMIGFVAEEMVVAEPLLVFYEQDGTTPRGVRYEETTALLAAAIQDSDARDTVRLPYVKSLNTET